MRFGFGRPKLDIAEIEREAQAELDSAVKRAQPPTDEQRTWVLPPPEVPELFPRRPARRRLAPTPERAEQTEPEAQGAAETPRRAARAAPRSAKARPATAEAPPRKRPQPTKESASSSKSSTKKATTPRRSSGRS